MSAFYSIGVALCALFTFQTFNGFAQTPTTNCTSSISGTCGISVDQDFDTDNGGFSSTHFTWTSSYNHWRTTSLTANTVYSLTSGIYNAGAATAANFGFSFSGSGADDIASYSINIRNAFTNQVIASCNNIDADFNTISNTICRSLTDADIQYKPVIFELLFKSDGNVSGDIRFDNFRTTFTPLQSCTANATTCPAGVSEDFNDNNRGDFTGANGFEYNAGSGGNGYFAIANVASNRSNYTLTSGKYLVPAEGFSAAAGFTYSGTGANDIASLLVNIKDNNNKILASCRFNTSFSSFGGTICSALNTIELAGKTVHFEFIFSTDGAASGDFRFENFRTNLPLAANTLPVTFTGFDAHAVTDGVLLTWNVAMEANVKHYEVERSLDGRSFSKIGVAAAANRNSYMYTDVQHKSGVAYYRIRNVDHDGQYKYSTVIRVAIANSKTTELLSVYPSPAQEQATIAHKKLSNKAVLSISTIDGKTVKTIIPAIGTSYTPVVLSGIPKGIYVVRLEDGQGNVESTKLIKQ